MNFKKIYNKEEQEFIKKWSVVADYDNDTYREVYSPSTGKRISTLNMAEARKRAFERAEAFRKSRDK